MAEPGWYSDPRDRAVERFWDGQRWTPHSRERPRRWWQSLWFFGAVAVLILASVGVGALALTRDADPTACSDVEEWRTNSLQTSLVDDAVRRANDVSLHADLVTLQGDIRESSGSPTAADVIEIALNKVELDCAQGKN